MSSIRRYEKIMEVLLTKKEVTVAELSESLGVTGKTIREDLSRLEEQSLIVRVHGGAVLAQSDQHGILSSKAPVIKHAAEKASIAAKVIQEIQTHDIIALDGGSTTLEIARHLENRPLTVITNDVYIISELASKDMIRLVVPGGHRVRNMLAGPEASSYVQQLNIQKAYISATGIHPQHGLSIYTGELIQFKRALIETAREVVAVINHHKFGQTALRTFATLDELTRIITDDLPLDIAKPYTDAGVLIV